MAPVETKNVPFPVARADAAIHDACLDIEKAALEVTEFWETQRIARLLMLAEQRLQDAQRVVGQRADTLLMQEP